MVFLVALLFLIVTATYVSTQATTPNVSAALTAMPGQAGGVNDSSHYTYKVNINVDRVQADERVRVWIWPTSRTICETMTVPPPHEDPDRNILWQGETGGTANGSLSRTLEGHALLQPGEGLCVVAVTPERCGGAGTMAWLRFGGCVAERKERLAYAFTYPDPPPVPASVPPPTDTPSSPPPSEPPPTDDSSCNA